MKKVVVSLVALLAICVESLACTSAIVASHRSSEGVPLVWKHRDSDDGNSRVEYVDTGRYAYTAVVPNNKKHATSVYMGINEKGLAVMNTATKMLPKATAEEYDACSCERTTLNFSTLMRYALSDCETVEEFEAYLRKTKRKNGFNTNIGIADADGNAAYFEIWDLGYCRYDVKDMALGFDVRSNFSFKGDPTFGTSKRRYDLMMNEMTSHKGDFAPQQFMEHYSRSYNSVKYGDVLATADKFICENHTVPRSTSVSSAVMICDKENPRMLVMNGHPVSSVALPIYVRAKSSIPQCVTGGAMRALSDDFRKKAYDKLEHEGATLNKEVVRDVLKINYPNIDMPKVMPNDMEAYNSHIDRLFVNYAKQVRKVLKRY